MGIITHPFNENIWGMAKTAVGIKAVGGNGGTDARKSPIQTNNGGRHHYLRQAILNGVGGRSIDKLKQLHNVDYML